MHEKSYGNNLNYDLWYKTLIGAKYLRIMLDKVNGFIRYYNGTKYFVLYGLEKYYPIYDRIRYLKASKSGINMFFLIILEKSKVS